MKKFALAGCSAFVLLLLATVARAQVTFTTIDVPGATLTVVMGINDAGDMVGYYADSASGDKATFLL